MRKHTHTHAHTVAHLKSTIRWQVSPTSRKEKLNSQARRKVYLRKPGEKCYYFPSTPARIRNICEVGSTQRQAKLRLKYFLKYLVFIFIFSPYSTAFFAFTALLLLFTLCFSFLISCCCFCFRLAGVRVVLFDSQ